jgi:hypothetical protein
VITKALLKARMSRPRCTWCGNAIDTTLPPTDPMSFTQDHTLPKYLYGDGPTTPMHRRCNSQKGTKVAVRIPGRTPRPRSSLAGALRSSS